jgi:hypothetical protein
MQLSLIMTIALVIPRLLNFLSLFKLTPTTCSFQGIYPDLLGIQVTEIVVSQVQDRQRIEQKGSGSLLLFYCVKTYTAFGAM